MKIIDRGESFARRLSVFYLFAIVGILFFGFFYYKYIPENQSELDRRGFRILNQLSNNIVRKNDEIASTFAYFDPNDPNISRQLSRNLNYDIVNDDSIRRLDTIHYHQIDRYRGAGNWKFVYKSKRWDALVKMNDFMEPVVGARDDLFDSYVLIKVPMTVLYQQKNLSASTLINIDSSLNLQKNSDLSSVTDIQVSGTTYKLFARPFSLGGDQMVLAGLISKSGYDKQVKALPVRFISIMLISILVALIFLPFIKVFMLSPKENMNRRDVLGATLSIYGGSALLVLIGFYAVIYFVTDSTFNARLRDTAKKITTDVENEFQAAANQIDSYSKIYQRLSPDQKKTLYYEESNADTLKKVDSLFVPDLFKNIDRVFWIDRYGNTLAKWNPYDFNAPLSNTAGYTFYKILRTKTESDSTLVVYPGKSNTTNEYQVFFMKRSSVRINTINNSVYPAMALGIAGFLNTGTRAVLPAGFGFCIVDNATGDVLLHSDNRRSLSENILTETDHNERLQYCLQNKTEAAFQNIYLYGLPNILYVNPIKGQNLSLVTFYNTEGFSLNIFRMVHFVVETILYLFITLILCIFFSTSYSSSPSKLEFKMNPVEWVRPCAKNILSYTFTDKYFLALLIFSVVIYCLLLAFSVDSRTIYYISLLLPFYAQWGFLASRRKEKLLYAQPVRIQRGEARVRKYSFFELIWLSKTTVFFILLINWIYFWLITNRDYGHKTSVPIYVLLFQTGAIAIMIFFFNSTFKTDTKYSGADAARNFSSYYIRSLYYSVLLTSIIPVSGIILYALRAEKIQYCKTDAYAIAAEDQTRQQYINSSIMPWYKEQVRQDLIKDKYFARLCDSNGIYLGDEKIHHDAKAITQNPFPDEPYISMLDDLFLITAGEYDSYSLHEGAGDGSWSFGYAVKNTNKSRNRNDKIIMSKSVAPEKNIQVESNYSGLLYSFSDVNGMIPFFLIVIVLFFIGFGLHFFTILVNRIFLLNFVPDQYGPGQRTQWIKSFFLDEYQVDQPLTNTEGEYAAIELQEMHILQITKSNKDAYQKIWYALESKERYLLYDFALDGYTNYRDAGTIVGLLEKGVLIYTNNELKFFELAFRNFILMKKGSAETEKLRQKYSVPGIWQTIRIPALVLISVAAIFLLLTQENVSHKLAGLITSIGALIPLVLEITKRATSKSN